MNMHDILEVPDVAPAQELRYTRDRFGKKQAVPEGPRKR